MAEQMFTTDDILEATATTVRGLDKAIKTIDENAPTDWVYSESDEEPSQQDLEVNHALATLYNLKEMYVDATILVIAALKSEFGVSDEDAPFLGVTHDEEG